MRALANWFIALLFTAAWAVVLLGLAEHIRQQTDAREATADAFSVVVDAGHGGFDGGAVGTLTGVIEAELNLCVAKLLEEELTARGAVVVMTRADGMALGKDKDKDMARRREIISDPSVDLVVSVHLNKFTDRSVSGAMAYYMQGSDAGQALAQAVIDRVTDAIGRDRRLANPGDYFMIRECTAPAVLVECGFLSNPKDEQLLQDAAHQKALAAAIADGVMAYRETAGAE